MLGIMQTETADELATWEHIITDIHEILRKIDGIEKKIEHWEAAAGPLLRMRDATRLRKLGKSRPDAVP